MPSLARKSKWDISEERDFEVDEIVIAAFGEEAALDGD